MTKDQLDGAIYEKYIAPTRNKRESSIGIEIEMPIIDLSGNAVREEIVIDAADRFREHFSFEISSQDDNGNVNSMTDKNSGDNLSFDCSYSNLELSFGKAGDLNEVYKRFLIYYKYLQNILLSQDYTLTGMGINPNYNINHNLPVPNERYRMLYHYLHTYQKYEDIINMRFHKHPDFGTFTSASQVQLDVNHDKLIDTLNVFTMLEPYKSVLFANSYLPEYPDYLCSRNMLWERSMQGYNPHNVGMFSKRLDGIDELIEYIKSQSIYCIMRNGKYIDFTPTTVRDYFKLDRIKGEYFDGNAYNSTVFSPHDGDLEYLRTFKFEDLTFRGTIEYRSSCTQPIKDIMTVAAFHLGLSDRLEILWKMITRDNTIYSHGYTATELQDMLSKREIPGFISKQGLSNQLIRILDVAFDSLKKRNKGEERFLAPLYERAQRLVNPAKAMINGIEKGTPVREFIEKYAEI